jgi:hypothetical protein
MALVLHFNGTNDVSKELQNECPAHAVEGEEMEQIL